MESGPQSARFELGCAVVQQQLLLCNWNRRFGGAKAFKES